jgi:hypothetical protein
VSENRKKSKFAAFAVEGQSIEFQIHQVAGILTGDDIFVDHYFGFLR